MINKLSSYRFWPLALIVASFCTTTNAQDTGAEGLANYPNIVAAMEKYGYQSVSSYLVDPVTVGSLEVSGPLMVTSGIPTTGNELILSGEEDRRQWSVFLDEYGARSEFTVSISYQNAVSVLPEFSRLSVWVNGEEAAAVPIQSPNRNAVIEASIEPRFLRQGENKIEIRSKHRHRVDCSVGATYELWTAIDLEKSFMRYATSSDQVLSAEAITTVPSNDQGVVPIYLVLDENENASALMTLSQEVAVKLGRKIDVQLVSQSDNELSGEGVYIFSGTLDQLKSDRRIAQRFAFSAIEKALAAGQSSTAFVRSDNTQSVLAIQLTSTGPAVGEPKPGKSKIYYSNGDERISLQSLGFVSGEFSGRLYRNRFDLRLPDDFYPADYDSVILHLYGAYAAGLDSRSRLITRINGVSRVSLPFGESGGDKFENKRLKLPLSFFRPGLNQIEISANLQARKDGECHLSVDQREGPRFFLSEKSYFNIPRLARMRQFPNIRSLLFEGNKINGHKAAPVTFEMASTDRDTIENAYQFVTTWAQASGVVREIKFTTLANERQRSANDRSDDAVRVVFGSFGTLAKSYPGQDMGVDFASLASNSIRYAHRLVDNMTTSSIEPAGGALSFGQNEMETSLGGPVGHNSGSGELKQLFAEQDLVEEREGQSFLGRIYQGFSGDGAGNDQAIEDYNSLDVTVVQGIHDGMPTTFVGYSDTLPDGDKFRVLFDQEKFGNKPLSLVGLDTETQRFVSKKGEGLISIGQTPSSFGNQRRLLAGWLSNNPWVFAGLSVVLILGLGLATNGSVNRTDRVNRKLVEDETA